MKVLVAGSSGVIGRRLIQQLIANGHRVIALTRSSHKAAILRMAGTDPVIADGLNRAAVLDAVQQTKPDAVVHEMTSLTGVKNLRDFDRAFAATNRLRTEGTDYLLEAAKSAGAQLFVGQSYAGWTFARAGSRLKTEDDPFDANPPASQKESLQAIQYLEKTILSAEGIKGVVLRYANLYGPGTSIAPNGDIVKAVRKRMLPIIGDGAGVWSFIHIDDAVDATVAAIKRGEPGLFNIGDDEPAPAVVWLPELARAVNAKPPMKIPLWLGRIVGGEALVSMMTRMRGMSNAKAKRELNWQPRYKSWREGFRTGLGNRS